MDDRTRKLYGDKDIGRIIKRAAELQEKAGRGDQTGAGVSIAELEQIARDLGIDPSHVRQAASELSGGEEGSSGFSLFGQSLIEARRRAKGNMSERDWELMVQEIRRVLGSTGETGKLGQALEWKTGDKELVSYQVTASPREGETELQIVSRRDGVTFLTYFVVGLVGLFGATAIAAPFTNPVDWLAATGAFGGLMGAARLLVGRWSKSQVRILDRLMDKLEAIVQEKPTTSSSISATEWTGEVSPPLITEESKVVQESPRPRVRNSA
jgi:hypothetical protein